MNEKKYIYKKKMLLLEGDGVEEVGGEVVRLDDGNLLGEEVGEKEREEEGEAQLKRKNTLPIIRYI